MNRLAKIAALFPLLAGGMVLAGPRLHADEAPRKLPAPQRHAPATPDPGLQSVVLSGGCFWGVQGVFEHVKGVREALSGYTGGKAGTATYEEVSTGTTGHAESVKVTYDPAQISYGRILQIFFSVALDPTRTGGQGPDTGSQYRSEIWTSTPEQATLARAYIAQLDQAHAFAAPIATRVDPLGGFYPAEPYHQDYLALNPDAPYIAFNDIPKVEALQRLYPADWNAQPVLVSGRPPA